MRMAERKKNSAVEDPQWTDCDREILFPLRRRNRYKLREMDLGGEGAEAGKHCREKDGDGGSLADVISNLLTGPVYEWIRRKVIGPGGEPRNPPFYRNLVYLISKPRGGLDLRLTLLKFVLWIASRLTVPKGELSSGAYTKSFFQYSLRFALAILPSRRT